MKRHKIQVVWWFPHWQGFNFTRPTDDLKRIYSWRLDLGWVELRRWSPWAKEILNKGVERGIITQNEADNW